MFIYFGFKGNGGKNRSSDKGNGIPCNPKDADGNGTLTLQEVNP